MKVIELYTDLQTIGHEIFILGWGGGGQSWRNFFKKSSSINTTVFFLSNISNWVATEICQKVLRKFVEVVETFAQIESSRNSTFSKILVSHYHEINVDYCQMSQII